MIARTVLTVAGLTLREASRRRVLWALLVMTVLLLGLSAWGFSRIGAEFTGLTTGEARLTASAVLNLVLFGISLIAVLGTAFLAGPTLAGEVESGIVLSMLARPVHRSAVLVGKWLGLVGFGAGFVTVAVLAQLLIVWLTTGYWPPDPLIGIVLLAAQTATLLTLGLLLSTAISPMASGMVAVGLFGATWIAGVVGGVGDALGNDGMAQAGSVSRMLLPTDGLWRGAMYAFQDRTVFARFGEQLGGTPFISPGSLTLGYQLWVVVWVGVVLGLSALAFRRRDL